MNYPSEIHELDEGYISPPFSLSASSQVTTSSSFSSSILQNDLESVFAELRLRRSKRDDDCLEEVADIINNTYLLRGIVDCNYGKKTPVFPRAISLLHSARHNQHFVLKVGYGGLCDKTISLMVYLASHIDTRRETTQAVVICRTKYLAKMMAEEIEGRIGKHLGVTTGILCSFDDDGCGPQDNVEHLMQKRPHIVFGTKGRTSNWIPLLRQQFATVRLLVIDEADLIVSPRFPYKETGSQLKKIRANLQNPKIQVLFTICNVDDNTRKIEKALMGDVHQPISIDSDGNYLRSIRTCHMLVKDDAHKIAKLDSLLRSLDCEQGVIIFTKNATNVKIIEKQLEKVNKCGYTYFTWTVMCEEPGIELWDSNVNREPHLRKLRAALDSFVRHHSQILIISDEDGMRSARQYKLRNRQLLLINYDVPNAEEFIFRCTTTGFNTDHKSLALSFIMENTGDMKKYEKHLKQYSSKEHECTSEVVTVNNVVMHFE